MAKVAVIALVAWVGFLWPVESRVEWAAGGSGAGGDSLISLKGQAWSTRIAESFILLHPQGAADDSATFDDRWTYEQSLMLEALHQMWRFTGKAEYLNFIRANVDRSVRPDGTIRTYARDDFNLDNLAGGRALLLLYRQTGLEKYRRAAGLLRQQLRDQPRTSEGGFWHKKIYPHQMWLDGLYMAEPFYAQYAVTFDEPSAFDDITNQFVLAYRHTRDDATGLCVHAWDESKSQRWADSANGRSPCIWGRAMGWYLMALVDVLDYVPRDHTSRAELITILRETASSLLKFRDPETGLWCQVVDQCGRKGNYIESSASAMVTYALAKGANRGYLSEHCFEIAAESFRRLTEQLVTTDGKGIVSLHETCIGTGLGGHPYRDGSFAYYTGVPRATNDLRGVGPFLLAAIEIEKGGRPVR